jgi:hypothetical protein
MKFTESNPTKPLSGRLSHRLLIIVAVALILFFPYKTTIVPEWKIRAVDKQGKPIPHARFRQSWGNYSYDIDGTEFLEGDDNGYVILPERAFYAPAIYRIPRSALAYLMLLAHGGIGNDASLNALTDKCSSEHLNYEQIKFLPDVIVIGCSEILPDK